MAKHQTLILPIAIYRAGKKRKCYHNQNHIISKGDTVLQVDVGLTSTKGYCAECAQAMLDRAAQHLEFLRKQLGEPPPDEASFDEMKKAASI